jgi:hypothetical protein
MQFFEAGQQRAWGWRNEFHSPPGVPSTTAHSPVPWQLRSPAATPSPSQASFHTTELRGRNSDPTDGEVG